MRRVLLLGISLSFGSLLAIGCTSNTPLMPTVSSTSTTTSDGSTLKVSAPTLVSPVTGLQLNTRTPQLVFQRAAGQFASPEVSYEIQVTSLTGDVAYTRTISGGAASGAGTLSHVVEQPLTVRTSYRWRARAVVGSDAGPWSNAATGEAMFVTNTLTAASTNNEFRDFFFSLIAQKGVGPLASAQALAIMEPDLLAVGILMEKNSAGVIRGRLYLPTGNPSNLFSRSVDIGSYGGPWQWIPRGGTTCEGTCPS